MMTFALAIALAAMPAADASNPNDHRPLQAKPPKEKRICKSDQVTGSRLTSRICKTQAEWDAMSGDIKGELQTKGGGVGS